MVYYKRNSLEVTHWHGRPGAILVQYISSNDSNEAIASGKEPIIAISLYYANAITKIQNPTLTGSMWKQKGNPNE